MWETHMPWLQPLKCNSLLILNEPVFGERAMCLSQVHTAFTEGTRWTAFSLRDWCSCIFLQGPSCLQSGRQVPSVGMILRAHCSRSGFFFTSPLFIFCSTWGLTSMAPLDQILSVTLLTPTGINYPWSPFPAPSLMPPFTDQTASTSKLGAPGAIFSYQFSHHASLWPELLFSHPLLVFIVKLFHVKMIYIFGHFTLNWKSEINLCNL